jgi:Spy/CpxP family protein refolding chaperone
MVRSFRLVTVGLLATFVIACGEPSFAQGPGPRGPGRPLSLLNLTDAQREQVREIVQRHREQMRSEIEAILTPEQMAQAEKLRSERAARMKERQERLQRRLQQRQPA